MFPIVKFTFDKIMNILFFLPSALNKGGVERATINLVNALSDLQQHTILLLTFNDNREEIAFPINSDVEVLSLGITNYKVQFILLIEKFNKVLKQRDIEYLVSVESMSLMFSFLPYLLSRNKIKLIIWEHFNFGNNNGRKLRSLFRKLAAKKADLVVTLTQRDISLWKANLKMQSKIVSIFNIGTNQSTSSSVYNENSKIAIAVGRYVSVKGYERLIAAWNLFQVKYDVEDWTLFLVGYGDGRENLERYIETNNIKNVYLENGNDGVEKYFRRASFFCMSSYSEGLPMVMIEAQYFGLPCIAYDIYSGPSEILVDESGLLIDDGNQEKYADAIFKLISNKELRKAMSKNALRLASRFDGKGIANIWIEELKRL